MAANLCRVFPKAAETAFDATEAAFDATEAPIKATEGTFEATETACHAGFEASDLDSVCTHEHADKGQA